MYSLKLYKKHVLCLLNIVLILRYINIYSVLLPLFIYPFQIHTNYVSVLLNCYYVMCYIMCMHGARMTRP